MEIIIIDDGVNEIYANVGHLAYNLEITETLEIKQRMNYDASINSHGSLCAAIIKKYAPGSEIGSLKILNSNDDTGKIDQLVTALQWCLNEEIPIIHMSLGSISYRDYKQVGELIARLVEKGCIIISACHNKNRFSIPAYLSGAIGVSTMAEYTDFHYEYNKLYLDQADVFASSRHLVRIHDKQVLLSPLSNSFATPMITSKVYDMLMKDPKQKICEIKARLAALAGKDKLNVCYSMRPDFIASASILNYVNCQKQYEYFFCSNAWYDNPDLSIIRMPDKLCNLVILPSYEIDQDENWQRKLKEFLICNQKSINGILYGGISSNELMKLCNDELHCFLWDENAYDRLPDIRQIDTNTPCDTPIIQLIGEDIHTIQSLATSLESEFHHRDYNMMKVSNLKYSYLYGMEYLPVDIEDKVLRYLKNRFELDVILYVTNVPLNADEDIQIVITKHDICQFSDNKIVVGDNIFSARTNDICNYIEEFYN